MTPELDRLLRELEPPSAQNLGARLRFGLVCASRVAHLLEDPAVMACLKRFEALLDDEAFETEWATLAAEADSLANRHRGSHSLDGVGHAAVSASCACAKAIAGRSRQAAEYAAYAAVYGQGGYGATSDPESFAAEYEWQAAQLSALLHPHPTAQGAATSAPPKPSVGIQT